MSGCRDTSWLIKKLLASKMQSDLVVPRCVWLKRKKNINYTKSITRHADKKEM